MDNPDLPNTDGLTVNHDQSHKSSKLLYFTVPILLIVGGLIIFYIYHTEQSKADKISQGNQQLKSQTQNLNAEIKKQQDINSGAVTASAVYKDPLGKIGLVNGTITMNLPDGWVRIPASDCTGGTIDSTVVCQDIAAVAPKSLVKSDGTASWSVPIKVLDYTSNDGSAENWLYSDYEGGYNTGSIDVSSSPINGYSAYSYEYQAFDIYGPAPEYTQAYYAVVHGKYGLVVDTAVQAGSSPSQQGAFDYRKTYQPQIMQMLKTIKFQD